MKLFWDEHWLLADHKYSDEIEQRLQDAGMIKGNDFLVRSPGWYPYPKSITGRRITNHRLIAYLFPGDGGGAILAKMILE